MTVQFLQRAVAEYNSAIDFYESQQPGLGFDFAHEVDATVKKIIAFPNAWQLVSNDVRRCLLSRFPYGLMYAVEDGTIIILSVFDLRRNPDGIPLD